MLIYNKIPSSLIATRIHQSRWRQFPIPTTNKIFLLLICLLLIYIFLANNNQQNTRNEQFMNIRRSNRHKNRMHRTLIARNRFRNGSIGTNNSSLNGKKLRECRLPRIDPWDPALVRHLDPRYWALGKANGKCQRQYPEISKLKGGFVQIDWKLLNKLNVCKFRCLLTKNDLELLLGPWQEISAKPFCDIVEVRCNASDSNPSPIYNYLHHQIYDPRTEEGLAIEIIKLTKDENAEKTESSLPKSSTFDFPVELRPEFIDRNGPQRPPDVHLIVFDSISHTMFLRSLSKTAIWLLERMEAVPFPHSNKVGKNSMSNGFAMLFGLQVWPIEANPMGDAHHPNRTQDEMAETILDGEPFIGFKFRDKNYRTMMAEDWARGAFNWPDYPGFEKQPVHHYMRPFQLRSEIMDNMGQLYKNIYGNSCKEYRHYLLDYLRQFIDAYENEPKFSIVWLSQPAHDSPNGAFQIDDNYYNFFREYEKKLDNAFLFVMGDHGLRFTSIRETKQGEVEDNNPALFVAVPKHLRQNGKLMANLRGNARQLVTHFDTHASLLDIAMEAPEWTMDTSFNDISPSINLTKIAPFGSSLFRRFDPNILRNCGTLRIPFEYCICQFEKKNVTKEELGLAMELAQLMVDKMNEDIRQQNASEHCADLELKFQDNGMPAVECLELEPDKQINIFQVTFETVPGDGRFWGYIQLGENGLNHKFISTKFARLNEYGKQAKCIVGKNHEIVQYCYCRDLWQRPSTSSWFGWR